MLIDVSYFTAGPRQILNATLGSGTTKEDAVIQNYIAEYQEEFLCRALGEKVGLEMQSYLMHLDEDSEAEHDSGKDEVCNRIRRAFADYVLYHILRDSGQMPTITGVVRLKTANQYVDPIIRQVTTWNRMCDCLQAFATWADTCDCGVGGIAVDGNMLRYINRFNL